jgi:hypothetical protein
VVTVKAAAGQPVEELTQYADLPNAELARILLCLLVEEMLREQLAQYLPPEPLQRREELLV